MIRKVKIFAEEQENSKTSEEIRNEIIQSGLPVFTSRMAKQMYEAELYTIKRAKKEHVMIDTAHVSGWFKVSVIRYIPLYKKIENI